MSELDSKPRPISRRVGLITFGLVRLGTILSAILLSVYWLASGVFGQSACHLAIYSPQCHFGINAGSLVVCRHGMRDSVGNLVADIIDCGTYRGMPPILDCKIASVGGFRWNYCKFANDHIEWSVRLPFMQTLAALVVMGGVAHVLMRRSGRPVDTEFESWAQAQETERAGRP